MKLHGIDFTSAPTRRKAITIATGRLEGDLLVLESLHALHDFERFEDWLRQPGPWLGAFDFPFSLPRALVEWLQWPTQWAPLMRHYAALDRSEIRAHFKRWCDSRAAGDKFAHRATDRPAGSSSPMKWVNPPVAYMLHAGAPRLLNAGVTLHQLHAGDPHRIALEGYPGLLARAVTRASYKSDEIRKQTPERRSARELILDSLQDGRHPMGVRMVAGEHQEALLSDGTGDLLDAALCLVAAAWSWQRRESGFGLPEFDPLEGWIVGA